MLFLLLAILSSTLVTVFMRLSESRIQSKYGLLAVNYIFCSLIAAIHTGPSLLSPQGEGLPLAVGLGVFGGVLFLGSFLLLQWNVQTNGVVLSSVFMKLGVLVPTILSALVFGEQPRAIQIVGMLLALAAILIMNLEQGETRARSAAGLLALLLVGGMTDFPSKIFEELGAPPLADFFLFLIFATALVLNLGLLAATGQRIGKKELLFGFLLAIPNYFSSKFMLAALSTVPAVVAFPSFSVATILAITLAGLALFGEKLGKRQVVALALILVALAMLNL